MRRMLLIKTDKSVVQVIHPCSSVSSVASVSCGVQLFPADVRRFNLPLISQMEMPAAFFVDTDETDATDYYR